MDPLIAEECYECYERNVNCLEYLKGKCPLTWDIENPKAGCVKDTTSPLCTIIDIYFRYNKLLHKIVPIPPI